MYNEHYFEEDHFERRSQITHNQLNHIQDHLDAVLSILYGHGSIDLAMLENSLEEVAKGLGTYLPDNDLTIERIDSKLSQVKNDAALCQEDFR